VRRGCGWCPPHLKEALRAGIRGFMDDQTSLKMYAAAVFSNNMMPGQSLHERHLMPFEKQIAIQTPYILESYHYIGKDKIAQQIRSSGFKIFLDSGAFSAKHSGAVVDVKDYCLFIKKYEDIFLIDDGIPVIAGLDVIDSAEETYHNVKYMESQGVRCLPTYHIHEDEKVLEWYVANYDYIAIGGVASVSSKQATIWMDRLWERYLTDGAGRRKVKVHGFATTSVPIMRRYPWWSVDSSTWVQIASYGGIWIPDVGVIKVSSASPRKHDAGQHITTLTDIERQYIESKVTGQGFDLERLANIPYGRFAYNLWAYEQIDIDVNRRKAIEGNPVWERQLF